MLGISFQIILKPFYYNYRVHLDAILRHCFTQNCIVCLEHIPGAKTIDVRCSGHQNQCGKNLKNLPNGFKMIAT